MIYLLAGAFILLVLVSASVAAGIGLRRWQAAGKRQAVARTATSIRRVLTGSAAGSPAGTVPETAYPQLDELIDRDLASFGGENPLLGPALQGMTLRLRLSGLAFRAAYRAAPPDLPRCREMVEQFVFALDDLERTLGPDTAKQVARRTD